LRGFWVVELMFQVKEKLGQTWGYLGHNSKVPKPLYNLVLLLDETLNMKPNGNEKNVLILEIYRVG
jgi:hypothetical protein